MQRPAQLSNINQQSFSLLWQMKPVWALFFNAPSCVHLIPHILAAGALPCAYMWRTCSLSCHAEDLLGAAVHCAPLVHVTVPELVYAQSLTKHRAYVSPGQPCSAHARPAWCKLTLRSMIQVVHTMWRLRATYVSEKSPYSNRQMSCERQTLNGALPVTGTSLMSKCSSATCVSHLRFAWPDIVLQWANTFSISSKEKCSYGVHYVDPKGIKWTKRSRCDSPQEWKPEVLDSQSKCTCALAPICPL